MRTGELLVLTPAPSRLKPVPLKDRVHIAELMVPTPASSRLKPVPLKDRVHIAELMVPTLASSRLKPVLQGIACTPQHRENSHRLHPPRGLSD